jgi:high-affinity Fe2+/Pb2+ permease
MKIPTSHDDPSTLYGVLVAIIAGVLGVLVVSGVIDVEQSDAILAALTPTTALVVALLIRRKAWAPGSVEVAAELARRQVEQQLGGSDGERARPLLTQAEVERVGAELVRLERGL